MHGNNHATKSTLPEETKENRDNTIPSVLVADGSK